MQSAGFYALTLVGKKCEYAQVHTFRFQPESPIAFVPGQYVHLLAPNSPPGRENVRHLSIASIPEDGPLEFTIDLSSATDYKKKFSNLDVGQKAHLFKVKGHFVLDENPPARVVFLAGGIGITPIRSLIRQIEKHHLPVEWRLGHVSRDEFLYQEELSRLGGLQQRVTRSDVPALVDKWTMERPDATYFVSGSARFVEGISVLLKQRGIPETAVKIENFE
jgi:ferredoxin-NADP reductase